MEELEKSYLWYNWRSFSRLSRYFSHIPFGVLYYLSRSCTRQIGQICTKSKNLLQFSIKLNHLPKTKTQLKWENKGQRDANWAKKNRKILNYKCSIRWMYPIKGYMNVLKGYTKNQYRPEASIFKSTLLKNLLSFVQGTLKQWNLLGFLKLVIMRDRKVRVHEDTML